MKIKLTGTSFRKTKLELKIGRDLLVLPDPCGSCTGQDHKDKNALSVWYPSNDEGVPPLFIGYIPKDQTHNTFKTVKVSRVWYKNVVTCEEEIIGCDNTDIDDGLSFVKISSEYSDGSIVSGIEIKCELVPNDIVFYDIDQNSEEWYELRKGKITSSSVSKIMAKGKGCLSVGGLDYLVQLLGDYKGISTDNYSNEHMERGHEQEGEAISIYEKENGKVLNGGIFVRGILADSPDGLIGDGIIEVKSVIHSTQDKTIKRCDIDPSYKWQVQFHLLVTQKEWCDYISYSKGHNQEMFIKRVYPDKEMQEELRESIRFFHSYLKKIKEILDTPS